MCRTPEFFLNIFWLIRQSRSFQCSRCSGGPCMAEERELRSSPLCRGDGPQSKSALLHFAPTSMHPSMIPSISALDRTPISATNTILVRGMPAVGAPPGASVARPPAN